MRYQVFFDMYKDAIKNTWTVDEIDFSDDHVDLRDMAPSEKTPYKSTCCFLCNWRFNSIQ